jgi:predicted Zn finger-like uncharacterized protein
MLTQCPSCETYFRVTAADLEAADGKVRCSRCEEVFDARAHLHALEDDSEPPTGDTAPPGEPEMGDLFTAESGSDEESAPLSAYADEAPAEPVLDEIATRDVEPGLDAALHDEPAVEPEEPREFPPLPVAGTRRSRLADGLWTAAGATLSLLLAIQLVHAYRVPLAENPRLGTLVSRTYATLDMPIEARRDLARIGVQRTEVTTHPLYDDVLMLSGAVVNEAPFAQALPVLRVRLEDRWGELVGHRLFEPAEYLRRPAQRGARFEPGQSLAIALEIVDPGSEAVGYAVEPCLRGDGTLVCHGDPATR